MAVSILLVRGLVDAVENVGIDRARLFEAAAFDGARIDEGEGRVALEEYDALIECALDLTGDPALGLHVAATASATTHNLTAHLVAHAPTLRDGMDALVRFQRLMGDRPAWRFEEDERTATLFYDVTSGPARAARFRAELGVAGVFRMVRFFAPDAVPTRVAFAHPAPPHVAEYERCFGSVDFGASSTRLAVDRALLSATQMHQDAEFHALLRAQAERRVFRLEQNTSYAERVRRHLLDHRGANQRRDMEGVSRALGLSVRSLRRRLRQEGASYGDLLDEARAILAKQLLSEDGRSIDEAAYELGFSDPSAFHHAFKRWTGTTPAEYRRKLDA